jgi:hypothetical protein
MRVLYDSVDFMFIFYDMNVASEQPTLKRDLCGIMMRDCTLRTYGARVDVLTDSAVFHTKSAHHERAVQHLGASVTLRFTTAEGAMAFKLAYIQGDSFIPWINQG